jgi:hypothetical protein
LAAEEEAALTRDPELEALTSQDGLQRIKCNWPASCKVTDEDLVELSDIEKDRIIRAQKRELITLAGCKEVDKWLGQRMLQRSLIERPDSPLKLEELRAENRELSKRVEQLNLQVLAIQQSKGSKRERTSQKW